MYIKLLGENENGFPLDCTVGKVYEVKGIGEDSICWFYDDADERNFLYAGRKKLCIGQWQVVNKNGEAV